MASSVSGTVSTTDAAVTIQQPGDIDSVVVQITGTWTGTLNFESSVDGGTTWVTHFARAVSGSAVASSTTANGNWRANVAGCTGFRVRFNPASSGSANVTLRLADGAADPVQVPTSDFHLVSAATTNATNVKASAGQVYGWNITNTNEAARYVKFHNTAGTPTAGAGVVRTVGVPPSGHVSFHNTYGIGIFTTGVAITTVTGSADADATAVGAGDLIIDIDYK